jgi:hypothetical protein
MPATATRSGVRSAFVREVLKKDPRANAAAVNEAWRAAGMPGQISAGLVNHLRSQLGLSGNLRARKASGTKRRRPTEQELAGTNVRPRAASRRRVSELAELEVEFDRLLMKVVEISPLADVADDLRQARRQIYAAMISKT